MKQGVCCRNTRIVELLEMVVLGGGEVADCAPDLVTPLEELLDHVGGKVTGNPSNHNREITLNHSGRAGRTGGGGWEGREKRRRKGRQKGKQKRDKGTNQKKMRINKTEEYSRSSRI